MIKFVTDDGKVFECKEEAIDHETKLAEKKANDEKQKKEQSRRLKEVDDAYENYCTLLKKYVEDYKSYHKKISEKTFEPEDVTDTLLSWLDIFAN